MEFLRGFSFEKPSLNAIEEVSVNLIFENLMDIDDASQVVKDADEIIDANFRLILPFGDVRGHFNHRMLFPSGISPRKDDSPKLRSEFFDVGVEFSCNEANVGADIFHHVSLILKNLDDLFGDCSRIMTDKGPRLHLPQLHLSNDGILFAGARREGREEKGQGNYVAQKVIPYRVWGQPRERASAACRMI